MLFGTGYSSGVLYVSACAFQKLDNNTARTVYWRMSYVDLKRSNLILVICAGVGISVV